MVRRQSFGQLQHFCVSVAALQEHVVIDRVQVVCPGWVGTVIALKQEEVS